MTKQLTPLRRKDQATGYAQAVKEIVAWLEERDSPDWTPKVLAHGIKIKFGKRDT